MEKWFDNEEELDRFYAYLNTVYDQLNSSNEDPTETDFDEFVSVEEDPEDYEEFWDYVDYIEQTMYD